MAKAYPAQPDSCDRPEDYPQSWDVVSIVGSSGAGKTTLLRALSGLLIPSSGTISLLGEPVNGVPDGMALVFQDYSRSLLPWLSSDYNMTILFVTHDIDESVYLADRVLV